MSASIPFLLNKHDVRRGFERAASTYDKAAFLEREVADRMFSRLEYMKLKPVRILDAGCRTGYCAGKLGERYGDASIIALDVTHNMLMKARGRFPWWKRHLPLAGASIPKYVCADLERLPLASKSVDFVWSNLVLHWSDLLHATSEVNRVLTTDGLFMFTTLGPDTLKELRHAFAGIDGYEHVNRFIDMHDVGDALVNAGFADPVMDMEMFTITFDEMAGVIRDLKSLGACNYLTGRRPGLMAPARWKNVIERYETFRRNGKLPVSIEVIYGHAWKPKPRSLGDGRQVVQFLDYSRGK